jgi:hypothetical protein
VSDASAILTALTTDVTTAVAGVTVTLEDVNFAGVKAEELPYCRLLLVDYTVEPLDWGQERRTWTVSGVLAIKATDSTTRETMQLLLDAIRDQVFADPTLDASVHIAFCATIVPYSHPDDGKIYGDFSVNAEKVV